MTEFQDVISHFISIFIRDIIAKYSTGSIADISLPVLKSRSDSIHFLAKTSLWLNLPVTIGQS